MDTGERVDGHDGLDEGATPPEIERRAQRRRDAQAVDDRHLAGMELRVPYDDALAGAQDVPGHRQLGRCPERCAGGAEQLGRGVAGQG